MKDKTISLNQLNQSTQVMKEIKLTTEQLRAIFIAGGEFEKQSIEFDMGERDDIDALDFGDLMKEFNISI